MAQFVLQNVRLSFPSLAEPSNFDGQIGKYEATFLFDQESQAKLYDKVKGEMDKLLTEHMSKDGKLPKIPAAKLCVKDGDEVEYDGYNNQWSFKASNKKQPELFDADKTRLMTADKFYAGCYVDVIADLWYQDNKFGKRINANLFAVRFRKDGDAFGGNNLDDDLLDQLDDIDDEDLKDFAE